MINVSGAGYEGTGRVPDSGTGCPSVVIPIMLPPLSLLSFCHKQTLPLSVSSSLHSREDGEDHLQFSNLYDSALFNRRPLFPVCRFSLAGCDMSDLQHPGAVSFAAAEGF